MEGYNEVLTAADLRAGDRIILRDGHADVVEVRPSETAGTPLVLRIDEAAETEEVVVPTSIWLEIYRTGVVE